MRKVKGVFLENLELNDFPVDVQVIQTLLSLSLRLTDLFSRRT